MSFIFYVDDNDGAFPRGTLTHAPGRFGDPFGTAIWLDALYSYLDAPYPTPLPDNFQATPLLFCPLGGTATAYYTHNSGGAGGFPESSGIAVTNYSYNGYMGWNSAETVALSRKLSACKAPSDAMLLMDADSYALYGSWPKAVALANHTVDTNFLHADGHAAMTRDAAFVSWGSSNAPFNRTWTFDTDDIW